MSMRIKRKKSLKKLMKGLTAGKIQLPKDNLISWFDGSDLSSIDHDHAVDSTMYAIRAIYDKSSLLKRIRLRIRYFFLKTIKRFSNPNKHK